MSVWTILVTFLGGITFLLLFMINVSYLSEAVPKALARRKRKSRKSKLGRC